MIDNKYIKVKLYDSKIKRKGLANFYVKCLSGGRIIYGTSEEAMQFEGLDGLFDFHQKAKRLRISTKGLKMEKQIIIEEPEVTLKRKKEVLTRLEERIQELCNNLKELSTIDLDELSKKHRLEVKSIIYNMEKEKDIYLNAQAEAKKDIEELTQMIGE